MLLKSQLRYEEVIRFLPDTEVWAYGSRVKGAARPASDLDLVTFASASQKEAVSRLRESFDESALPFRVALFIWDKVLQEFRKNIEEVGVVVQKEKTGCELPKGWQETTLGEFCPFSYGKNLPKKVRDNLGKVPVFGSNGVVGHHSKPLIQDRGIIIGRKGTVGTVTFSSVPFWPIDTTFYISEDSHRDLRYTFYLLKSLRMEHMNADSAVPGLNRNAAHARKITIPPLPEQKAIAHILGSLDDKIELNRRMNETLEAMAQALFKSWFVDFDPVIDNALAAGNAIPDELKEKAAIRQRLGDKQKSLPDDIRRLFPSEFAYTEEMGWVPKEWEVSKVGQEVEITGGGTPNKKDESFWSEGANAFCTPKDMSISPSTILLKTQFQLTDKGVSKVSSGQLSPGAVLISSRAPIGYLVITNIPVTINQGIIAMLKQAQFSELFLFCWAKCNMNEMLLRANGSTFLEINKKNFRNIPFLVPSKDILTAFNNLTNEFIMRITSCSKEIQSLRFFRDNLFSKLLAGEIRIQKTDKILEKLK